MFQLERLNVVNETLNQIHHEMKSGQFDEDLRGMFSKTNICRALAQELAQCLLEKAKSEEETDEDS